MANYSAWKIARSSIVASVRRHMSVWSAKKQAEQETNSSEGAIDDLSELFGKECKISNDLVVIVDDNNYLRSMRHEYYKVARALNAGFCQLMLQCSRVQLVLANESRPESDKVPAEVAEAMADKMEEPDPGRNAWERFSFKVDTFQSDNQRAQVGLKDLLHHW